jgi:hypothetical protein
LKHHSQGRSKQLLNCLYYEQFYILSTLPFSVVLKAQLGQKCHEKSVQLLDCQTVQGCGCMLLEAKQAAIAGLGWHAV